MNKYSEKIKAVENFIKRGKQGIDPTVMNSGRGKLTRIAYLKPGKGGKVMEWLPRRQGPDKRQAAGKYAGAFTSL